MKIRTIASFLTIAAGMLTLTTACTHSRAKQLMQEERCLDCHTIKGNGGAVGPNLTTIGSRRSRDYIVQQIRDPKSHNAQTAMPSYGDRLPEQDISALANYLSSLK